MRINYAYEKGTKIFVSFSYKGRNYTRECKYSDGFYHFTFKRQPYMCYARRIY